MIDEFKKFTGEKIPNVVDYIRDYVNYHTNAEFVIMIGTDSLPFGFWKHKAIYTEVIAIYKLIDGVGQGAHCIYRRSKKIRVSGTHERLLEEAHRLVVVSSLLRDNSIERIKNVRKLDPQLDFNKNEKWESRKYLSEAVGYVTGMGFTCNVKPDSPAATYAADHICRYKEIKTNGRVHK